MGMVSRQESEMLLLHNGRQGDFLIRESTNRVRILNYIIDLGRAYLQIFYFSFVPGSSHNQDNSNTKCSCDFYNLGHFLQTNATIDH